MKLSNAEVNHLRRLVAWVRCEIGQAPDEMVKLVGDIAEKLKHVEISEDAKERLLHSYYRAESIPKYVRAAVSSLDSAINQPVAEGQVVEHEPEATATVATPVRMVGCETPDGLIKAHPESEYCDVCRHTAPAELDSAPASGKEG